MLICTAETWLKSLFSILITNIIIIVFIKFLFLNPCLYSPFYRHSTFGGVHIYYFDFLSFNDHDGSNYHIFFRLLDYIPYFFIHFHSFFEMIQNQIDVIDDSSWRARCFVQLSEDMISNLNNCWISTLGTFCCRIVFNAWKVKMSFQALYFL